MVEYFGGERDGHPCISLEGWVKLRGVVYLTSPSPRFSAGGLVWRPFCSVTGGWALIRVAVHRVGVERASSWLPLSDR